MNRTRLGIALAAVSAVAVLVGVAVGAFADETPADPTVVALTEFAASSAPTTTAPTAEVTTTASFPAIEDSGIRDPEARNAPTAATFEIVEVIDHDPQAFTQGLELDGDRLFESTGLVGRSTVREVDPTTGAVLRSRDVPGVFAEGLTVIGDEIVQITWTDEIAYRYERDTFELIETHAYDGQGWGLCHDGSRLVMSDGSSRLTFRDPASLAPTASVEVTFNGAPVTRLNELECVSGRVWANIWLTPLIIEIDPDDGTVLTVLDAGELRPESTTGNEQAVLNGIAYDDATDTFLVTGKLWPVAYRIRLVES